jgi:hypothetical protein
MATRMSEEEEERRIHVESCKSASTWEAHSTTLSSRNMDGKSGKLCTFYSIRSKN